MKYQKRISVGAYLKKGEDVKENDIVEIASEGKEVPSEFGTQNVFLIKTDKKEGNVGFNQTTINNLIDAWGEDSLNWVGKKVKVWAILQNVQGKMRKVYYFLHPNTILDEDSGEFILPDSKKKTPIEDDIKTEDIPY